MLPDVDSLNTYGGARSDYAPVVDPVTDESAVFRNRYAANVAMMTQTVPRAMRSFVGATGATPTDPVSGFVHAALWGSGASVKPTMARTALGVWTVTFPTTVSSELTSALTSQGGGLTHTVNFRRALAQVECAGTLYHATAKVIAANVIEVRGWTGAAAADDLNGLTVTVWGW